MGLYGCGIFGLGENLQQFIVRQEVESWEGISLGFQVLRETFLYLLQQFVTLAEVVQESVIWTQGNHLQITTGFNVR